MPEQVTLNLGEKAPIPKPLSGHKWGGVVHIHEATWLASWKENINGSIKYVFLAATSSWKGQSDMQKFEKARDLKVSYSQSVVYPSLRYTLTITDVNN
jgi:DNA topoisomerase-1